MESVFKDLITASPGLAVAAFIVWAFLRDRKSDREAHLGALKQMTDESGRRTDRCHDVQDRSTEAVSGLTTTVVGLKESIDTMNGRARRYDVREES